MVRTTPWGEARSRGGSARAESRDIPSAITEFASPAPSDHRPPHQRTEYPARLATTGSPHSPTPSYPDAREALAEARDTLAQGWVQIRPGVLAAREAARHLGSHPRVRSQWPYLVGCLCMALIFSLMFPIWIKAEGSNGFTGTNAFGRMIGTTRFLRTLSPSTLNSAHGLVTTGVYGLGTAAVVLVTALSLVAYMATGTAMFRNLATWTSCGVIAGIIATMIYLTSLASKMYGIASRMYDFPGQVANVMNWAINDGNLPFPGSGPVNFVGNASFQPPAYIALIASVSCTFLLLARQLQDSQGGIFARLRRAILASSAVLQTARPDEDDEEETPADDLATNQPRTSDPESREKSDGESRNSPDSVSITKESDAKESDE